MAETVNVQQLKRDGGNLLEVIVPRGTQAKNLTKIHNTIFTKVIPRLTGCAACLSGITVHVRERWDQVAHIDVNGKAL